VTVLVKTSSTKQQSSFSLLDGLTWFCLLFHCECINEVYRSEEMCLKQACSEHVIVKI
jgi:hypothetical protein